MVQQQFFPSSDRPELIVDWNLPQNSSIGETSRQMAQFEREMLAGNPGVEHWSTYVGRGAPRFVLSFDVQPANASFGQTIIVTKASRGIRVQGADWKPICRRPFRERTPTSNCWTSGLRSASRSSIACADEIADGARPGEEAGLYRRPTSFPRNLVFDWNEPARVVKVDVLQDKARQLGVVSEDIATTLNSVVDGCS